MIFQFSLQKVPSNKALSIIIGCLNICCPRPDMAHIVSVCFSTRLSGGFFVRSSVVLYVACSLWPALQSPLACPRGYDETPCV